MFQQPLGSAYLKMAKDHPNADIIHFRVWGNDDRLFPVSPQALAEILVHKSYDFEKLPGVRNFLRQFLGDGLLMTEGEEHRHQRKHLLPAFSFRHVKDLYPIFWQKSVELCQAVEGEMAERRSDVVDITHFATKVTMDIIGLAGMGRDMQTLKNGADELVETYEEILEPTAEKAIYFVLHLLIPSWVIQWLPWRINERVKVTTGNLKRICRELVREKKGSMKTR